MVLQVLWCCNKLQSSLFLVPSGHQNMLVYKQCSVLDEAGTSPSGSPLKSWKVHFFFLLVNNGRGTNWAFSPHKLRFVGLGKMGSCVKNNSCFIYLFIYFQHFNVAILVWGYCDLAGVWSSHKFFLDSILLLSWCLSGEECLRILSPILWCYHERTSICIIKMWIILNTFFPNRKYWMVLSKVGCVELSHKERYSGHSGWSIEFQSLKLMWRANSLGNADAGKDWRQKEKRVGEDEMVR